GTRMLSKDEVNCLLEPQCSPSGTDKIKILVVEDDHTTQLLYDKGLFNQIFDKKLVASGKEALLVYEEWHPDIIILDIYLPEMTGYQILKAIRTNIEDKKTTIVMATSLSGREDVLSCMTLGVEGYIIKPFSLQEIGAKILGYYAKKEPERARKADTLCREILKQSQIRWLLDKDKSKTKEDTEGVGNGTSPTTAALSSRRGHGESS
ncbi:MAG: response regulator, partial [Deltaproteobacteria bacterium]|nr:response regulator [Deltaproteobacteria bacterium]